MKSKRKKIVKLRSMLPRNKKIKRFKRQKERQKKMLKRRKRRRSKLLRRRKRWKSTHYKKLLGKNVSITVAQWKV